MDSDEAGNNGRAKMVGNYAVPVAVTTEYLQRDEKKRKCHRGTIRSKGPDQFLGYKRSIRS